MGEVAGELIVHNLKRVVADAVAYAMSETRRVKLFRNGRNQAVRIPREFELPGDEAILRREGGALMLEPAKPASLQSVLAGLKPLREDLHPIEELPAEPVDL